MTSTGAWLFVPDSLVWVFQKLLISWEFPDGSKLGVICAKMTNIWICSIYCANHWVRLTPDDYIVCICLFYVSSAIPRISHASKLGVICASVWICSRLPSHRANQLEKRLKVQLTPDDYILACCRKAILTRSQSPCYYLLSWNNAQIACCAPRKCARYVQKYSAHALL